MHVDANLSIVLFAFCVLCSLGLCQHPPTACAQVCLSVFFSLYVHDSSSLDCTHIRYMCIYKLTFHLPCRLNYTNTPRLQVASLGKGDTLSTSPDSSAETNASVTTTNTYPSPGAEGYEEWIKARASAIGVPVALEKEREAWCVLFSCDFHTLFQRFTHNISSFWREFSYSDLILIEGYRTRLGDAVSFLYHGLDLFETSQSEK